MTETRWTELLAEGGLVIVQHYILRLLEKDND